MDQSSHTFLMLLYPVMVPVTPDSSHCWRMMTWLRLDKMLIYNSLKVAVIQGIYTYQSFVFKLGKNWNFFSIWTYQLPNTSRSGFVR